MFSALLALYISRLWWKCFKICTQHVINLEIIIIKLAQQLPFHASPQEEFWISLSINREHFYLMKAKVIITMKTKLYQLLITGCLLIRMNDHKNLLRVVSFAMVWLPRSGRWHKSHRGPETKATRPIRLDTTTTI